MTKTVKLSFFFTFVLSFSAYAEIVTDGTTGSVAAHTLQPKGTSFEIPQHLGTPVAGNLFHSFSTFNINKGESAVFTSVDSFQNVISRVTGGTPSTIDGLLKSTIANANFYFINPAGVTFGANAKVNVPAAFHVSTAQKLNFGSDFFDTRIGASAPPPSALTIAEPTSFGFLGASTGNNALIEINGPSLKVVGKPKQTILKVVGGQTMDVVAENITIKNNARLLAKAGEVRLVAIQGAESVSLVKNSDGTLPLPAASPTATNAGNIIVNSIKTEIGNIDASGDGGGRVAIWGGATSLTKASIFADNSGSTDATPAKGVDIRVYSLNLNKSIISFDTYSNGSPNIEGNSADAIVKVETSDFLNILNGSSIKTITYTDGNAANVLVSANTLNINRQNASNSTGVFSQANKANGGIKGNAGKVTVNAKTLNILNGGAIFSSTATEGNAGNVTVTATDALTIQDKNLTKLKTGIFSDANNDSIGGNAGDVSVNLTNGTLSILNGGSISSSTYAKGNAGKVSVNLTNGTLDILNGGLISSDTSSQGNANPVTVTTGKLDLLNGGVIESSTYGKGNAGSVVNVTVDNLLTIDSVTGARTGIFSDAQPSSEGTVGSVSVKAQMLDILRGGLISSSTYSQGDAGKVSVTVADTLNVDGKGFFYSNDDGSYSGVTGINSQAEKDSSGKALEVTIHAKTMNIRNGGGVSSSTFAQGNSGKVLVTADNLTINSDDFSHWGTGIFSQANSESTGNANNVTVNATDAITLVNGGIISSSTLGRGNAGNVTVIAPSVAINNATISAKASKNSSGQTGDVTVIASKNLFLANQAEISIKNEAKLSDNLAAAKIKAGIITVSAADIDLKDSKITAEAINPQQNANVDAGDITINFSGKLAMDPSFITTSANTGNGGNININGGQLISLENSGFLTSVTGANGNGGNINVIANSLIMNNGVIQANAVGGKGGDINLNLRALIPSYNKLIKGGTQVVWQSFQDGFNVIQAASQNGINGSINISSPQFSISGSMGDLNSSFAIPILDSDPCLSETAHASSLARIGKGSIPANEAKTVFVPAIADHTNANLHSQTDSAKQKILFSNKLIEQEKYPCMAISSDNNQLSP